MANVLTEGPRHDSFGDWEPDHVGDLISRRGWCGKSFENGLLRFHDARSGALADEQVETAFGVSRGEIGWFAVDWLGRHFGGITPEGLGEEHRQVVLADVATDTLTRLMSLADFMELILSGEVAEQLNASTFKSVVNGLGARELEFDQCVSYVHPPCLGGKVEMDNLEISDIDVYWTVVGQVVSQLRNEEGDVRIDSVQVDGPPS